MNFRWIINVHILEQALKSNGVKTILWQFGNGPTSFEQEIVKWYEYFRMENSMQASK